MKILICDDDTKILRYLAHEINKRTKQIHNLFFAKNENEMMKMINRESFDLLIMDICLKNVDGIDLAFYAEQKFPNIKVIFITGYEKTVENIFIKMRPYAYVSKPINIELLCSHINNIDDELGNDKNKYFLIQSKNINAKIPFNDIIYIESDKRKLLVHTVNSIFQFYDRIDNIEDKFPKHFVRCHKSYLLNLYYTSGAIVNNNFHLINGENVPISRSKLIESTKSYLDFQGGVEQV